MYHIFEVHDYKGGELSSSINLTAEEVAAEIIESFLLEVDWIEDQEQLKINIYEAIEEGSDIYAGGGETVMEIYKSVDGGKLEAVGEDEFEEAIIRKLKEYHDNN